MSSSAQTPSIPALKNILFATDFSPCSEAALPYLRELAARSAATVHVVHVVAPEVRGAVPLDKVPELDLEQTDAEDAMQLMLAGDAWQGIAHTSTVEHGHVWEVLASVVEEKSIDLIVLGTHGRRGLKKLVLGSTAEQVIRRASCPVLTVGPQAKAQAGFATILFATDFSAGSLPALRYAAGLAHANRSHLIVLHALPPSVEVPSGDAEAVPVNMALSSELIEIALKNAGRQMEELVAAEQLQALHPEMMVECGPAAEVILGTAQSRKVNLIAMRAHHAGAHSITTHLPWATVSAIVCEAPCPVLTVRD
jgi:nucleotide-binding universal stress UspA family protein